jgi:hypothetical protein
MYLLSFPLCLMINWVVVYLQKSKVEKEKSKTLEEEHEHQVSQVLFQKTKISLIDAQLLILA